MNKITYKVILREDQPNQITKLCPLSVQAFVNGKKKVLALNLYVLKEHWDKDNQQVVGCKHAKDYNLVINRELAKINDIIIEYRLKDKFLSADTFADEYTDFANRANFLVFYENDLKNRLRNKEITPGTYRTHLVTLNKLQQFQPRILFAEVTVEFIEKFNNWHARQLAKTINLMGKKAVNESHNTKAKNLSNIRTYFNRAVEKKKLKLDNPFDFITIKEIPGDVIWLDKHEIQAIFKVFENIDDEQRVFKDSVGLFLFSCFTGLRISDSKRIQSLPINNDLCIEFNPIKQLRFNKKLLVPMNKSAKYFYSYLKSVGTITCADQTINEQLKRLMIRAGIKKKITTHVARHTFATQFIASGGNVVYLQQILGHSDIRTTMRYVHIVDEAKREQIQLMDGIINIGLV